MKMSVNKILMFIILVQSCIIYFLYINQKKELEIESFANVALERVSIMSVMSYDEKNRAKKSRFYLLASIYFDLLAIDKFKDIENKIDKKEYCSYLNSIKEELYYHNSSSQELIKNICD